MSSDPPRVPKIEFGGTLADIAAIIESAKARDGRAALERHIVKTLPDANEKEVLEAVEVATEIIDSIPVFLARARQEARSRGLESVAGPLLDQAELYFLRPLDLIPEMTQGMVGLLDDSYLVVRTLESLDQGPQPFLDWDLDYPARFLRRLIGGPVAQRLDDIALQKMREVSAQLSDAWTRMAHEA
ncbi:MAG: DUF1232 domain-containing protein [Gemmatimonadales bacterium]